MEKYIGTKQIKATPAWRLDGDVVIAKEDIEQEVYDSAKEVEDGYRVEYEGGYLSWSPKDVFEAAYHQSGELSFGDAVIYLKQGCKVARKGWNGKGMFLWLRPSGIAPVAWCKEAPLIDICIENGGEVPILPSISMKTADGEVVPWTASQTDILANDWEIVQ